MSITVGVHTGETPRERIVAAAARLLDEGGADAVSTRAVGAAAGVQAPTIYRLFGDKQGLLDAVVVHGFVTYLAAKTRVEPSSDPVDDLRTGWDQHVDFGLTHPEVFRLMNATPHGGDPSPALVSAADVLTRRIHRVAEQGRLRISEELAAQLIHAAGSGTTLTLINQPAERRDMALSVLAREAVIAAVTTDAPATSDPGPVGAAVALRAVLDQTDALSESEQSLLQEWLVRIATAPTRSERTPSDAPEPSGPLGTRGSDSKAPRAG